MATSQKPYESRKTAISNFARKAGLDPKSILFQPSKSTDTNVSLQTK